MRFHRLDLNLLVVLDTLIAEQNVSRAAERLNLTQPAISNSLAKLRQHFDDDLLVKLGRQMVPTPLAESLREPIRETLMNIQAIAESRPSFDPSTVEKEFTIVASDFVAAAFLADALQQMAMVAPGVSINVLPVMDRNVELLARGDVDLLIMPEGAVNPDHPHELLFEDRYTCIAWSGNRSLKSPITIEEYMGARHVLSAINNERRLAFDEAYLHQQGHQRRSVAVVHNFTLLPSFVVGTQHIATLHERLAQIFVKTLPLKILTPAFDLPLLRERIQWHRNRENDPANLWLRNFLIDIAAAVSDDAFA